MIRKADLIKRIIKLENALQIIRAENDRAIREFTNISNKLIKNACKVLDEDDENT